MVSSFDRRLSQISSDIEKSISKQGGNESEDLKNLRDLSGRLESIRMILNEGIEEKSRGMRR